jgi:ADP-ribosylglycohydrolase
MACSVYRVLADHGTIDQDALAADFAGRHDFDRGYGPATNRMLRLVREGGDWRTLSAELFDGKGSWGNGAAMRVAPLGAWFADDLPSGHFLDRISEHVPASMVRDGIAEARQLLTISDPALAGQMLGNGRQVTAHDTVPFTLWVAARQRHDYEAAVWTTAVAGGDVDTTCAIVGGIVAVAEGIHLPPQWRRRCEPLPDWAGAPQRFPWRTDTILTQPRHLPDVSGDLQLGRVRSAAQAAGRGNLI